MCCRCSRCCYLKRKLSCCIYRTVSNAYLNCLSYAILLVVVFVHCPLTSWCCSIAEFIANSAVSKMCCYSVTDSVTFAFCFSCICFLTSVMAKMDCNGISGYSNDTRFYIHRVPIVCVCDMGKCMVDVPG